MKRFLGWLALAVSGAVLSGAGGDTYRWERPLETAQGWNVLELPDDVLAHSRPGIPDVRLAAGDAEVPYALDLPAAPGAQPFALHDVESSPDRETSAIVDRGARPALASSLRLVIEGAGSFLKPAIVEASDDRALWRQIARGSIFRADGAEMVTLRFAPNDRRYWRLRLDDRNGAPVRPVSVDVPRPVEAPSARRVAATVARAPSESPGVSTYTLGLPSEHLPVEALVVDARDPVFERRARVFERVVFRDEVSRRLVGESTVFRSADGKGGAEIALADVSSSVLELEVADGDSPPLDLSAVTARVAPVRLVFRAGPSALVLRYGSDAARAPRYDLGAALVLGRPREPMHEAHVGTATDRAPSPPPRPRGASLADAGAWTVHRPIALPARGTLAYVDLNPADVPRARIVDAEGRQVPYVVESVPHHVRRAAELSTSQKGRTTEVRVRGIASDEEPDVLELRATAPEYFARSVVVSEATRDDRGPLGAREIGAATWTKRPGEPFAPLRVSLQPPQASEVTVTIDNGDNQPLTLGPAAFDLAVDRVVFLFERSDRLTLLTGNPTAPPPAYDLALLASAILAAPAELATVGPAAPSAPAPPATPRWFWLAVAGGGALLVLVLLRSLGTGGSEGAKP